MAPGTCGSGGTTPGPALCCPGLFTSGPVMSSHTNTIVLTAPQLLTAVLQQACLLGAQGWAMSERLLNQHRALFGDDETWRTR